jgi:hypothetical protein
MVQWFNGKMVYWCNGTTVQRLRTLSLSQYNVDVGMIKKNGAGWFNNYNKVKVIFDNRRDIE